jgi:hypothetical protein
MKNKTLCLTLIACAVAAFVFTLARYVWIARQLGIDSNPSHRMGYAFFISVVPALAAFVVVKLARRSSSWKWTAAIYGLLFVVTSALHVYARTLSFR